MLKKLLKYDLKSMFKYWWIAAIISVALSITGGFCFSVINSDKDVSSFVGIFIIALIISIIGIVAFLIVSYALIYVRFYKNFFTDEGYLTFTLPVKRIQLLNSKLISGILIIFITTIVTVADVGILLSLGFGKAFFDEFGFIFKELFKYLIIESDIYVVIYIIEILILIFLSVVFTTLVLFACITVAAVLVKKAKVIAAIALYYAINGVISGFLQTLFMYGNTTVNKLIFNLEPSIQKPLGALILLSVIAVFTLICILVYTFEYFLLDRKLNLN